MKTHRLVAAVLLTVQLACLLFWLPAPTRLIVSIPAGVLTVAVLARADWQSPLGRTWLVATTAATILFNLVLALTFLSHDDGGADIGWGFAILGALLLAGFAAAALFASFLGSVLAAYLDKTSDDSSLIDRW